MPTISSPAGYPYAAFKDIHDSRLPAVVIDTDEHRFQQLGGGFDNMKSGVNNPGWRDRIAKRVEAGSAYSRKVYSITPGVIVGTTKTLPTGVTANYVIESFSRTQSVFISPQVPISSDAALQNRALERLKSNLRQQTSSANVMAPLAEARELHGLIHQATSFTYKFLQSLVEIRKGRTRRALNLAQDSWLGWNFGIAPMLHDIDDAGKAVSAFLARQDSSYRIKGSAHTDGKSSYTGTYLGTSPYGAQTLVTGDCHYRLKYQYIGSFYSRVLSANDYSVFNHLGIDLTQIPATLWELTAFSWMGDYFANIGKYLDDMFYCPPGNLVYLSLTRNLEVTCSHFASQRIIPGNPNNVFFTYAGTGAATVKIKDVSRSVLATLPHVGLRFKSLDEVGANAIPKLLNLVSVCKVDLKSSWAPLKPSLGRSVWG